MLDIFADSMILSTGPAAPKQWSLGSLVGSSLRLFWLLPQVSGISSRANNVDSSKGSEWFESFSGVGLESAMSGGSSWSSGSLRTFCHFVSCGFSHFDPFFDLYIRDSRKLPFSVVIIAFIVDLMMLRSPPSLKRSYLPDIFYLLLLWDTVFYFMLSILHLKL